MEERSGNRAQERNFALNHSEAASEGGIGMRRSAVVVSRTEDEREEGASEATDDKKEKERRKNKKSGLSAHI